jgi:hypothetical protein
MNIIEKIEKYNNENVNLVNENKITDSMTNTLKSVMKTIDKYLSRWDWEYNHIFDKPKEPMSKEEMRKVVKKHLEDMEILKREVGKLIDLKKSNPDWEVFDGWTKKYRDKDKD